MFQWSAMLILKILKIVKQQHNSLEIKLIAEELFFDTLVQQNNWLGKLRAGYQGHPKTIFRKYMFESWFEI